jgi:putative ABC transport system permease protein
MKLSDLNELAWQNLREAFLRNSLTTLGIAVGVASLVAMLSLGIGLQDMMTRRLQSGGLFDTVMVRPQTNIVRPGQQARDRLMGRERQPEPAPTRLDDAARRQLEQLAEVVEVYPEVEFTADARLGDEGRLTRVSSLPSSASSNEAFEGMLGRFFSAPDARETILHIELAQTLAEIQGLQPADLIGKEVVLRYAGREPITAEADADVGLSPEEAAFGFSVVSSEVSLRVAGIITAETVFSGPGSFENSGAYLPVQFAETLRIVEGNNMREVIGNSAMSVGEQYSDLTVRVARASSVPAVQETIKQMGFRTFSLMDFTRNLSRVFAILDLLLGIFGSLALAVASLGIVNTLVMAILERRREIGVLKALGASDRDVRQLFFAEAGVMGLAGGAGGVLMGWGIGRIIQFVTATYLERQGVPAENIWLVPWWLVVGAMAFSLAVSLGAGMYPASRAARLDPVEALRYQ